jgi:hypothetical protein
VKESGNVAFEIGLVNLPGSLDENNERHQPRWFGLWVKVQIWDLTDAKKEFH